jgi:hypothetical protein
MDSGMLRRWLPLLILIILIFVIWELQKLGNFSWRQDTQLGGE